MAQTSHNDRLNEINAAELNQGAGSVASKAELDSLARAIADIVRAGGVGDLAAILLDTDTTLPGEHTAIQNAVTAIQNNTRFTAAVPVYMCRPAAGNESFRFSSNLYDTSGNMEDPSNNEILVRIIKDDGNYITATLYKENGLSNALDDATDTTTFPVASGWRAMEREAIGKYCFFYDVSHNATEESLTVEFGWTEDSKTNYQSRSTEIADVHGDLAAILADTNELQTDWVDGGRLDLIIDAIKAQADKNKLFAETATDTQLTIANGVGEITIKTFGKATYGSGEIRAFKVDLDKAASGFQTLAAAASTIKLRVYEKIDGTNYRLRTDDGASYTWTQGVTNDKVAEIDEISFSEDMQIRAVLSGAPTGTINLPWLCELNKNMEV